MIIQFNPQSKQHTKKHPATICKIRKETPLTCADLEVRDSNAEESVLYFIRRNVNNSELPR